jgi:Flp pilus assembly CpaF family ATPase
MLGWKILNDGEYKTSLRILSEQEERFVDGICERFKEETRSKRISNEEEARELLEKLVRQESNDSDVYLGSTQADYLAEAAFCHAYGFSFISKLIEDPEIEEISIIGPDKPARVFIRNCGWKDVDACFVSESAIADMINRMASTIGRRITLQNPRINAILPDGSRLHASLPPVSRGEITIRKFRESPFSPAELCENTLSKDAMALLSLAMQGNFSVIVAGNTASGKTTTLNSLFSFIPLNERIVIVEETPEINILHPHQLRLVSNTDMGITLKDLVRDTLRMRPDRLIVGEVRGQDEVDALFDALLGGQARGCYATFHAQSGNETLQRLKTFGVNAEDLKSIDLVVVQRRMLRYDRRKRKNYEIRRVTEICEVNGNRAIPLFQRDTGGELVTRKNCEIYGRIAMDLGLSDKELKNELKERIALLSQKKNDFKGFFTKAQKDLYGIRYESD